MTEGLKRARRRIRKVSVFAVCVCIAAAVLFAALVLQTGMFAAHRTKVWTPDYEKIDVSAILDKGAGNLTDEDYAILFAQTGLKKTGIDRALSRNGGKNTILSIQNGYFENYSVEYATFVPFACQDDIAGDKFMTIIDLEPGDILISFSTHISFWRMGHAALVINDARQILQASTVGINSTIFNANDVFSYRLNFIVLSPKADVIDSAAKKEIAEFAANNLCGIPYDPTAGVLTDKNSCNVTQCSHLVWYAYNQFGYDIDANGGAVVTPNDILLSPYLEVVQVFGIDPAKLGK